MQRQLPREVLEFISRRIDSVPHLEALLLLCHDPAVSWSDEEISRRVYVSRDVASKILSDLLRHGLIRQSEEPGRYRYDPGWDNVGLMSKVRETYRRQLVHVAETIHAKAASPAVQEFAQAFRLKRED